jgi:hypothetical protein
LDREQFSSVDSLVEALDVSLAIALNHLHNSLGMKIFYLNWIPHQVTNNLWKVRVARRRELLRMLEAMQRPVLPTSSHPMRAGLTWNTKTPHNGWFLAMKCLKE